MTHIKTSFAQVKNSVVIAAAKTCINAHDHDDEYYRLLQIQYNMEFSDKAFDIDMPNDHPLKIFNFKDGSQPAFCILIHQTATAKSSLADLEKDNTLITKAKGLAALSALADEDHIYLSPEDAVFIQEYIK